MKKILLTALIASMLIVPLGNTALAGHAEDAPPVSAQDFVPGDAPAGNAAPEAMLPAIHGLVLAMLNHDADEFDRTDSALAWESLYNMLSLYGELDSRCDESNGELFLLEETVRDYASALDLQLDELGPLPEELWDRINYDNASQGYVLVCGDTGPVQIQMDSLQNGQDGMTLSGSLIYLASGEVLASFQAGLKATDSMFGFAIDTLTVNA